MASLIPAPSYGKADNSGIQSRVSYTVLLFSKDLLNGAGGAWEE